MRHQVEARLRQRLSFGSLYSLYDKVRDVGNAVEDHQSELENLTKQLAEERRDNLALRERLTKIE